MLGCANCVGLSQKRDFRKILHSFHSLAACYGNLCLELMSECKLVILLVNMIVFKGSETWRKGGRDGGGKEECTSSDPMICSQTSLV